jgi:hypothetical protein
VQRFDVFKIWKDTSGMNHKVYLAGQSNKYGHNWRKKFEGLKGFSFYDPNIDSDQSSPDTFFPQDLMAIKNSKYMVANPSDKPSEGTWIEIGYFYSLNTKKPGDFCKRLIIIWKKSRKPTWAIKFVKKTGYVVSSSTAAAKKLQEILK